MQQGPYCNCAPVGPGGGRGRAVRSDGTNIAIVTIHPGHTYV